MAERLGLLEYFSKEMTWRDTEVKRMILEETYQETGAEGEDVPSLICRWLKTPPHFTTVRINLKSSNREEAISRINQHLVKNHPSVTYRVFPHESYPDTVIIENPSSTNEMKSLKENRVSYDETRAIVVDSACGLAVLRGANVYAPGVLGACHGIRSGQEVDVYAEEGVSGALLRGSVKNLELKKKVFVGQGTCRMDRSEIFKPADPEGVSGPRTGVAVDMTSSLFGCPSLNPLEKEGLLMLQNLPSIATGYALDVKPGDMVLDMCAAPGGKTALLASRLSGGKVVAIDRSQKKIDQIQGTCTAMSVSEYVTCHVGDSTKIADPGYNPTFPDGHFDKILLDAPCSALGQRPQLTNNMKLKELLSFPKLQKKLFDVAVKLLKPGGHLVYSTCSITRGENEDMVDWACEKFQKEIAQDRLFEGSSETFKRFGSPFDLEGDENCDTIGFFMAKFVKL